MEKFKMNIEERIINKAMEICENDGMQYPDFDVDIPLSLADALTIIVTHDEPHDSDLICDDVFNFLDEKFG
jgi:hypothetical protein